nr:hypothetical protein [Tanacetum cinerariifolium]
MTVRAQFVMSPGHSARVTEAMDFSDSVFCKRYRSSYETPSSSSSLALPVRKRYRGTSELILDTNSEKDEPGDEDTDEDGEDESLDMHDERKGLDDEDRGLDDEGRSLDEEGLGLEGSEEEDVPEGQQRVASVVETAMGEPLGLGYEVLRRQELAVEEDQVYNTFETPSSSEWSFGSLLVSLAPSVVPLPIPSPMISLTVPSPIASLVTTLTATIFIDEDQFIKVRVQLELHESILHDHTQRLDAMPPTLFAGIDRDAALQHELQEMRGRVTALEKEKDSKER